MEYRKKKTSKTILPWHTKGISGLRENRSQMLLPKPEEEMFKYSVNSTGPSCFRKLLSILLKMKLCICGPFVKGYGFSMGQWATHGIKKYWEVDQCIVVYIGFVDNLKSNLKVGVKKHVLCTPSHPLCDFSLQYNNMILLPVLEENVGSERNQLCWQLHFLQKVFTNAVCSI